MAWYDKLTSRISAAEPDETMKAPGSVEEVHAEQNWPMLAALAIFALAFAVLIVLVARWAYHHWSEPAVPASSQSLPQPPPTDLQPR